MSIRIDSLTTNVQLIDGDQPLGHDQLEAVVAAVTERLERSLAERATLAGMTGMPLRARPSDKFRE